MLGGTVIFFFNHVIHLVHILNYKKLEAIDLSGYVIKYLEDHFFILQIIFMKM